jgi:hypothetical protein
LGRQEEGPGVDVVGELAPIGMASLSIHGVILS